MLLMYIDHVDAMANQPPFGQGGNNSGKIECSNMAMQYDPVNMMAAIMLTGSYTDGH